ncbi:MAG TPA: adenosine kinase [Alphaproteobacteria bacterium]|nr:adenosine kinase [Alphaproteobacteria bacterium]HOO50327.1 adenosine kinase [Alphaproteobacteria bacterium]
MAYITGFCRAYTDYIIPIDSDDVLREFGVEKNTSSMVDMNVLKGCIERFNGEFVAGGPVANSMAVISALGGQAAFIGKIADDEAGRFFQDAFDKASVVFKSKPYLKKDVGSGLCVIFISPDGSRTMLFNRGVVDNILKSDVIEAEDFLQDSNILFAGFPARDGSVDAVFNEIRALAPNAKVATSLQAFDNLSGDIAMLTAKLLVGRASIVFGNEYEFFLFAKALGYRDLKELSKSYSEKIFCNTIGEKGVLVAHDGYLHETSSYPTNVIDTTGAGDAFAGGFLYGLNVGKNLEEASKIGAYCASQIIGQYGARPKTSLCMPEL